MLESHACCNGSLVLGCFCIRLSCDSAGTAPQKWLRTFTAPQVHHSCSVEVGYINVPCSTSTTGVTSIRYTSSCLLDLQYLTVHHCKCNSHVLPEYTSAKHNQPTNQTAHYLLLHINTSLQAKRHRETTQLGQRPGERLHPPFERRDVDQLTWRDPKQQLVGV